MIRKSTAILALVPGADFSLIGQKEIIWHVTCDTCNFYWTMPTMEEKLKIETREYHCPLCGSKGNAKEVKNPS